MTLPCVSTRRSELARDDLQGTGGSQRLRVIVDVYREQARSYKDFA